MRAPSSNGAASQIRGDCKGHPVHCGGVQGAVRAAVRWRGTRRCFDSGTPACHTAAPKEPVPVRWLTAAAGVTHTTPGRWRVRDGGRTSRQRLRRHLPGPAGPRSAVPHPFAKGQQSCRARRPAALFQDREESDGAPQGLAGGVTDSQPVEAYARRRLRQRHTCACGRSSTPVLPPPEGEFGPDAADLLTRFFHPTANGSPKRRAVSTIRSGPRQARPPTVTPGPAHASRC
jgi:hypothetical protein